MVTTVSPGGTTLTGSLPPSNRRSTSTGGASSIGGGAASSIGGGAAHSTGGAAPSTGGASTAPPTVAGTPVVSSPPSTGTGHPILNKQAGKGIAIPDPRNIGYYVPNPRYEEEPNYRLHMMVALTGALLISLLGGLSQKATAAEKKDKYLFLAENSNYFQGWIIVYAIFFTASAFRGPDKIFAALAWLIFVTAALLNGEVAVTNLQNWFPNFASASTPSTTPSTSPSGGAPKHKP